MTTDPLPLEGTLVVDVSRLLPGGVLARQLLDLGARLIKIEEPGTGDPMRMVPPIIDGIGIGFVPPLWEPDQVNELMAVSTEEARAMVRRLAREEGVLVGLSAGAAAAAAPQRA